MEAFLDHTDRQFYALQIDNVRDFIAPAWGPYACLLWSAKAGTSASDMAWLAQQLLGSGCTYFMGAGEECEAWHDAVDRAFIDLGLKGPEYDRRFVMTTWHAGEPPEEAAFFLVHCTVPAAETGLEVYSHYLLLQLGGDWALGQHLREAVVAEATTPPDDDDDDGEAT